MAYAPAGVIEGPSRNPLPFGLFSTFTLRPEGDKRWIAGVTWEQITCGPVSGIGNPDCTPEGDAIGLPKTFIRGVATGEALGFSVYGSFLCGAAHTDDAQERAAAHLYAREEARAEQAFWTGDLGNTPNLQDSAVDVNSGGALSAIDAIGIIEQEIAANYGSLGVIHMTRRAAITGLALGALIQTGNRLTTGLGTPVAAGAGYPGTSPAGAAPAAGQSWIYGSPATFGYRSAVFFPSNRPGDLMDRATNDMYAIAERNYLLGFDDCAVSAVRMTLGCCDNG